MGNPNKCHLTNVKLWQMWHYFILIMSDLFNVSSKKKVSSSDLLFQYFLSFVSFFVWLFLSFSLSFFLLLVNFRFRSVYFSLTFLYLFFLFFHFFIYFSFFLSSFLSFVNLHLLFIYFVCLFLYLSFRSPLLLFF